MPRVMRDAEGVYRLGIIAWNIYVNIEPTYRCIQSKSFWIRCNLPSIALCSIKIKIEISNIRNFEYSKFNHQNYHQMECSICKSAFKDGTVKNGKYICSPNKNGECENFILSKNQEYKLCFSCCYNTLISSSKTYNDGTYRITICRRHCINPFCPIKNSEETDKEFIDD